RAPDATKAHGVSADCRVPFPFGHSGLRVHRVSPVLYAVVPQLPVRRHTFVALRWAAIPGLTCLRRSAIPVVSGLLETFRRCLAIRSEEHTSELQSPYDLVCRLLLEKK